MPLTASVADAGKPSAGAFGSIVSAACDADGKTAQLAINAAAAIAAERRRCGVTEGVQYKRVPSSLD